MSSNSRFKPNLYRDAMNLAIDAHKGVTELWNHIQENGSDSVTTNDNGDLILSANESTNIIICENQLINRKRILVGGTGLELTTVSSGAVITISNTTDSTITFILPAAELSNLGTHYKFIIDIDDENTYDIYILADESSKMYGTLFDTIGGNNNTAQVDESYGARIMRISATNNMIGNYINVVQSNANKWSIDGLVYDALNNVNYYNSIG